MKSGVSGCTHKEFITLFIRAVDPDPDPAFQVNPDPAFQVNPDPDPIRMQGFDDQNRRTKITNEQFFQNQKLHFIYVHTTGKDFSQQKRTSSTSKNEIY
jgi:hypothetical protein